jgi:hypothetical protein
LLSQHPGVELKQGEYTRLGRVYITVEWLEDDELTEEASPTYDFGSNFASFSAQTQRR